MKTREGIIKDRLYDLYTEYVNKQNERINHENSLIEKRNNEIIDQWKRQIQRSEKPMLRPKINHYTQEQFMTDFEVKYKISMYKSKFSKYLNGTTCPPEPILYCFADLFDVSYDYLIGNDDVRKPSVACIEEFLHLDDSSINTLLSFNSEPLVLSVLNALLSDKETAKYMFLNLYEQAYQSYKRKNLPDSYGDYDTEIIFRTMSNALSLNKYMENQLLPYLNSDFSNRLQEDIDYIHWRHHHFDEYESGKAPSEEIISNEGIISSIVITPVNQKDSP